MTLRRGEQEFTEELSTGDGPIDAAFFVVEKITGIKLSCRAFEARSTSIGRDAQAEATLEVEHQGAMYRGRGVSTDTVEATIKAILNAVNRITVARSVKHPIRSRWTHSGPKGTNDGRPGSPIASTAQRRPAWRWSSGEP